MTAEQLVMCSTMLLDINAQDVGRIIHGQQVHQQGSHPSLALHLELRLSQIRGIEPLHLRCLQS